MVENAKEIYQGVRPVHSRMRSGFLDAAVLRATCHCLLLGAAQIRLPGSYLISTAVVIMQQCFLLLRYPVNAARKVFPAVQHIVARRIRCCIAT